MNQKLSVLVVALLAVTMITAGCLGGDDNGTESGKSNRQVELETLQSDIPVAGGWAQTGDNTTHIITCQGPVTQFKVVVDLQDSDEDHAGSDQGSAPDTVTIIVSDGLNQSETKSVTTGMSHTFTFPSSASPIAEGETMASQWTIHILHDSGQIGNPVRFGFLFNMIDQGCAWGVTGSYSYVEGGAVSPTEEE